MKKSLLALAASCAVLASVPATAKEMAVEYGDLNLTSAKGQQTLERRLEAAARSVCGYDDVTTGTRIRSVATQRCYHAAKTQAKEHLAAIVAEHQLGG